jgi:hypothetical protein
MSLFEELRDAGREVLAVDFDGVISKYDGWKGHDVFGKPTDDELESIKAVQILHAKGWYVHIFTCRPDTPALRRFLWDHHVPFDAINSLAHNPPCASIKPHYHAILDDRGVNPVGRSAHDIVAAVEWVSPGFHKDGAISIDELENGM